MFHVTKGNSGNLLSCTTAQQLNLLTLNNNSSMSGPMPYNCPLQHRPGKDNPADFMSRHPKPVNSMHEIENSAELYTNYICSNAPPKAMTHEEVKLETKLQPSLLPEKAWTNVAVDFVGPFSTDEHLIVVIDEYSRYLEVEILTSTSAKATIPKLDAIFSRQGIPKILI